MQMTQTREEAAMEQMKEARNSRKIVTEWMEKARNSGKAQVKIYSGRHF